jgi:DNA-binding transcriptional ArsR family regulator
MDDSLTADRHSDDQQALLKALNHPLRRKLLKLVIEREELSPVEASAELGDATNLSNVSYHMTELAKSGAVALRDTAQVRGAVVHFYAPNPVLTKLPWVREIIGLDD